MRKLNTRSILNISSCHEKLQKVVYNSIKRIPFTIIEGHRNEETQNEYYKKGTSKLKYPNSKHNKSPSRAFDFIPYPLDWNNTRAFQQVIDVFKEEAEKLGIKLVFGGEWKTFKDWPHVELAEDE